MALYEVVKSIAPNPAVTLQSAIDTGILKGLQVGDIFHISTADDFSGGELDAAVAGALHIGDLFQIDTLSPVAITSPGRAGDFGSISILKADGRILSAETYDTTYQTGKAFLLPNGKTSLSFTYNTGEASAGARLYLCVRDSDSTLLDTIIPSGRTGVNDILLFDNQVNSNGDKITVDLSGYKNLEPGMEIVLRGNLAYDPPVSPPFDYYSGDRLRNTIYHTGDWSTPGSYAYYTPGICRFLINASNRIAHDHWTDGDYDDFLNTYSEDLVVSTVNQSYIDADFEASPLTGSKPLRVQFENKSVVVE